MWCKDGFEHKWQDAADYSARLFLGLWRSISSSRWRPAESFRPHHDPCGPPPAPSSSISFVCYFNYWEFCSIVCIIPAGPVGEYLLVFVLDGELMFFFLFGDMWPDRFFHSLVSSLTFSHIPRIEGQTLNITWCGSLHTCRCWIQREEGLIFWHRSRNVRKKSEYVGYTSIIS